jgi:hypothetical protein
MKLGLFLTFILSVLVFADRRVGETLAVGGSGPSGVRRTVFLRLF